MTVRTQLKRFGATALLAALAFSGSAGIASAQWYHGPPPPPPQREYHAFRHGYAWEGGHWRRVAGRWVWTPGRFVAIGPGHRWIPGHWQYGPRGRYWVEGHRA
jgi:hypothetical protein